MSEKAGDFNEGSVPDTIKNINPGRPVLIAGPTASGKSALAMEIADRIRGVIVNADALQVFSDWRILTARPSPADEAQVPHTLYGHVPGTRDYSVGQWLRDVTPLLMSDRTPVIVGGTGLYFTALTEGLADIPQTPSEIRDTAIARLAEGGIPSLLTELDSETLARIDQNNPMRVQRAWEVLQTTGRGLASWQDETPPPLAPLTEVQPLVFDAPKFWLTPRIEKRFDLMLDAGALDEARRNAPHWSLSLPSAKAIGARELIAHVRGELSLDDARTAAVIATRQYAKRQRSWFRARMRDWQVVEHG